MFGKSGIKLSQCFVKILHMGNKRFRTYGTDGSHLQSPGVVALLFNQLLSSLDDFGGAVSAVGKIGTIGSVSRDENTVEAGFEGIQRPLWGNAAGAWYWHHQNGAWIIHVRTAGKVNARVRDIVCRENQYLRAHWLGRLGLGHYLPLLTKILQ
jgi:hypothetical protein